MNRVFLEVVRPEADLADFAADNMFGLATTRGFVDGNKRVALAAASIFVWMNGWRFTIPEKRMFVVALAVAKGELDRDGLADIL
jgi:death on curing protein